jgi:hypothetical protein
MRWLQLFFVCLVSILILAAVPFPTHSTVGDLRYLLESIVDIATNGL